MSPAERDAVLNVTWNIDLPGIGNLAQAVKAHWSTCENKHNVTYPSLFDDNAENNGNVREEKEEGSADMSIFLDCNAIKTECDLIQNWIDTKASPMTIYAEMQSLMSAPGYTAAGEKYDRLFALILHTTKHPEVEGLLCTCGATVNENDWHLVAPGEAHKHEDGKVCPWYIKGVDSAALTERITTEEGFAEWAETATPEMIARALTVKSLDHVALEANTDGTYNMYVVRYAEPVGTVDAQGFLTYKEVLIAWVDMPNQMLYPLYDLPADAPAIPSAAQ